MITQINGCNMEWNDGMENGMNSECTQLQPTRATGAGQSRLNYNNKAPDVEITPLEIC